MSYSNRKPRNKSSQTKNFNAQIHSSIYRQPQRSKAAPGTSQSKFDGAGNAIGRKHKAISYAMNDRPSKRRGASPFDGATSDDNRSRKNNGGNHDRKWNPFQSKASGGHGKDHTSKRATTNGKNTSRASTNHVADYEVDKNAYPSQGVLPLAQSMFDQLRNDEIYPPKWPQSRSPAAMTKLRENYNSYRDRVRDSLVAANLIDEPGVQKRLEDAIDFKGICDEMCPDYEKVCRITENAVHGPEKDDSQPNPDKMVKKHARSAAGQDAPLPMDVLSVAGLRRTLEYMIGELLTTDEELPHLHHFLWDRTRAIRRDFTFHSTMSQDELKDQVYCFETIARFHVVSLHLLSRPEVRPEKFSEQQEIEQLSKTLISLTYTYDACKQKGVICDNEPEFRAYYALFFASKPDIPDTLQRAEDSLRSWKEHDIVQQVVALIESLQTTGSMHGPLAPGPNTMVSGLHSTYFRIVKSERTSYTLALFAEIHFNTLRRRILTSLRTALKRPKVLAKDVTPSYVNSFLQFDSDSECVEFVEKNGLSFVNNDDFPGDTSRSYLDVKAFMDFPRLPHSFSRSLVELKRNNRSLPDIIHKTISSSKSSSLGVSSSSSFPLNGATKPTSGFPPQPPGFPSASPFAQPSQGQPAPKEISSPFSSIQQPAKTASPFAAGGSPFASAATGGTSLFANGASIQQGQSIAPSGSQGSGSAHHNPFASGPSTVDAKGSSPFSNNSPFVKPATPASEPAKETASAISNPFASATSNASKSASASSPFASASSPKTGFSTMSSTQPPSQDPAPKPLPPVTSETVSDTFTKPSSDTPASNPLGLFSKPSDTHSGSSGSATSHTFAPPTQSAKASFSNAGAAGSSPQSQDILGKTAASHKNSPQPAESQLPLPSATKESSLAASSLFPSSQTACGFPPAEKQPAPMPPPQDNPFFSTPAQSSAPSALPTSTGSSLTNPDVDKVSSTSAVEPAIPETDQALQPVGVSDPTRDVMGDFTRWYVEGDAGLLDEFQNFMIQKIVGETYDQYIKDERERRRREEEERDLVKARKFQIYNLSTKFFYRWRDIARRNRLRRRRLQDREEYQKYMEQKRRKKRAEKRRAEEQAQARRLALSRNNGVDPVQEFRDLLDMKKDNANEYENALYDGGVLAGLDNERDAASKIVRYESPQRPQQRPQSSTDDSVPSRKSTFKKRTISSGQAISALSKPTEQEKHDGAKTKALRERFFGNRSGTSSLLRRSLPASSTSPTPWRMSTSPSESATKRVSKVSDRWRLKAMGLVTMPNGTALPEKLANSMLYDGKRYDGWGDFGLGDSQSDHRRSRSTSADMSRSASVRNAFEQSFRGSSARPATSNMSPPPTKRKRMAAELAADDECGSSGTGESSSKRRAAANPDDPIEKLLREAREVTGSLRSSRMDLDETTGWFKEQSELMQEDMLFRGSSQGSGRRSQA